VNYAAWQLKRRELSEREKAERSENWDQARAGLQASITEQAVRELYDKLGEVEARLGVIEQRPRIGRPPKEAE
jgi:hypothetical protein